MPPLETCKGTRDAIALYSHWIQGLMNVPNVEDPDYDDFEREASGILKSAVGAYSSRPAECEMEISGDSDCFECARCAFDESTDPS